MTIPYHPLADIFPVIEGSEFDDLVEDIRANGLRDPIMLHEGMILDGRNRFRALQAIRDTGALRGAGWGAYAGEPILDEDLSAADGGLTWFERYSPMLMGEPLAFVISRNLKRRHLDDRQRASVAAKIANLAQGGDRSKPPIGGLTTEQAATTLNVAPRQVERARVVHEQGVPELREALDRGEVAISAAEKIARLPESEQREEVSRINGHRSLMASRQEPDDSLDYFPTPPWATRALMERVLPQLQVKRIESADEPACGEGHIAEVLREYCPLVRASDIFDYGYGEVADFLDPRELWVSDWKITNPPFGDNAIKFVLRALDLPGFGVAMFFRSQWAVEGVKRYEAIFRDRPPTLCAFFVERVNLCKGRWEPEGSTATAYCWLVWIKGASPRPPFWIPPGCREALNRPDDAERFNAHPVTKRERPTDAAGSAIEHDATTGEVEERPERSPTDSLNLVPQTESKPAWSSPLSDNDVYELPDFLLVKNRKLAMTVTPA